MIDVSFESLDSWLGRIPVIAQVHPLVPLSLSQNIDIVLDADVNHFLETLDNRGYIETRAKLILSDNEILKTRFPQMRSLEIPPIGAINRNMRHHLGYARTHLLTTHKVAQKVEEDVRQHHPELVVMLLIDGLSYADVLDWDTSIEPCFVDGPSVTYRFYDDDRDKLVEKVGFASIVNTPPIYQRLYRLGYRHARGYTYWKPKDNIIANYMFTGMPSEQVVNFEAILQQLSRETLPKYSYIQIVREGLDGLAHGKRELRRTEIEGAIRGILDDIERLLITLKSTGFSVYLYATADHGMLWKDEHQLENLKLPDSKPRYSPRYSSEIEEYAVRMENGGVPYYLLCYPYLGSAIRANDSGVHGGLSYQESIVPFLKFKV